VSSQWGWETSGGSLLGSASLSRTNDSSGRTSRSCVTCGLGLRLIRPPQGMDDRRSVVMAKLKPCKDCGQDVSTNAVLCPHCGAPAKSRNVGCMGCLGAFLGLVMLTGVISALFSDVSTTAVAPSATTAAQSPNHSPHYARQSVNVREGPGTEHAVVYSLVPGGVAYLGTRYGEDWVGVYAGPTSMDTIGYVYRELLSKGLPPDFLLMDTDWTYDERYRRPVIEGEIRNLTGTTARYVSITCTLLDNEGRQVGATLDNTTNLGAGRIWRFSALVSEDGVASYQCGDIIGR
jgi:hypothetical protein